MREHLFSAQAEVAWVHVWGLPNWWSNLLGTPRGKAATFCRVRREGPARGEFRTGRIASDPTSKMRVAAVAVPSQRQRHRAAAFFFVGGCFAHPAALSWTASAW